MSERLCLQALRAVGEILTPLSYPPHPASPLDEQVIKRAKDAVIGSRLRDESIADMKWRLRRIAEIVPRKVHVYCPRALSEAEIDEIEQLARGE